MGEAACWGVCGDFSDMANVFIKNTMTVMTKMQIRTQLDVTETGT